VSTTHAPVGAVARHPRPVARPATAPTATDDAAAVTRAIGVLAALAGLAFGVAAFAYQPLLTGAVGITLGLVAKHTGVRFGRFVVAVAMVGTIVGPVIGATVYALLLAS
jgi:hypothetical protein